MQASGWSCWRTNLRVTRDDCSEWEGKRVADSLLHSIEVDGRMRVVVSVSDCTTEGLLTANTTNAELDKAGIMKARSLDAAKQEKFQLRRRQWIDWMASGFN